MTSPVHYSFLVSVSGIDGAGKTTFARSLVQSLHQDDVFAEYHWLRPGTSLALDSLRCFLRYVTRRTRRPRAAGGSETPSHDEESLRKGRLWRTLVCTDYLLRVTAQVARARLKGGVHVFDRYIVDAAGDLASKYGVIHVDTLSRLAPRPDLTVLLSVPIEVAQERTSTPVEQSILEAAMAQFEKNIEYFDLVIDAHLSLDEAVEVCRRRIGSELRDEPFTKGSKHGFG